VFETAFHILFSSFVLAFDHFIVRFLLAIYKIAKRT